jgi:hypothetical protein
MPRQLDKDLSHSIHVPGEGIMVPLEMKGVVSYFESHKPSEGDKLHNC